jgi:hypothetical protein
MSRDDYIVGLLLGCAVFASFFLVAGSLSNG